MLQNAYFLAKIGADTAENEQHFAEINLPKTGNPCRERDGGSRTAQYRSRHSQQPRQQVAESGRASGRAQLLANSGRRGMGRGRERARSRLYQNEILQGNMRSTAFFKLYKICILLHRCNLKNFAKKNGLKNQHLLWKFSKIFANLAKFAKFCKISKISAW